MAGENAAAFRAFADAVVRGDAETVVALVHPESEADSLRSSVEGPWLGRDGARAFMRSNEENFDFFRPDFSEIKELPDGRVLAVGTIHARPKGGGVELDIDAAVVCELRDGLIYRYKDYGDAEAARAAVG
jgi:ketosteroid isomerase-like protein